MFAQPIAQKLNIKPNQVETVLQLLQEGSTIPFIARYRKDKTGALDEVQVQQIQEEHKSMLAFAERKAFIEKAITEQGKMTDALLQKINSAITISQLEDIYLPFKPKRKTKGQTARENGLEPLANRLMEQQDFDIESAATAFISDTILTVDQALQGARDIIAEHINENSTVREKLRRLFEQEAMMISAVIRKRNLKH